MGKSRIWMGLQTVENGLIDEIGTLDDAVAKAAELAGLRGKTSLRQYDGFTFDPREMMPFYLSVLVRHASP